MDEQIIQFPTALTWFLSSDVAEFLQLSYSKILKIKKESGFIQDSTQEATEEKLWFFTQEGECQFQPWVKSVLKK